MKQYLLSVWLVDGAPVPGEEEMAQAYKDVDGFNAELMESGRWVFGGGLHPVETATTVQVRNGDVLTTDGPFAESKEHLGGFWVIKAADLDEALSLARRATVACRAPVEVRPFEDEPES
ncbi:MAG TPA: YciI family protein [Kineosporiaceae bacterium]|nr:YciI family protein [Kineosporiaceae bacterium]